MKNLRKIVEKIIFIQLIYFHNFVMHYEQIIIKFVLNLQQYFIIVQPNAMWCMQARKNMIVATHQIIRKYMIQGRTKS